MHIAVAGADGVGGNARSWAIVAKAGMKQADAPQEKARPRTSPQINDTSRAKGKFTPMRLYTFMCVGSRVIEAVGWRGILLHGGPHEQFIVMIKTKNHGLGVSCFAKLNKLTVPSCSLPLQTLDFKRSAARKFLNIHAEKKLDMSCNVFFCFIYKMQIIFALQMICHPFLTWRSSVAVCDINPRVPFMKH